MRASALHIYPGLPQRVYHEEYGVQAILQLAPHVKALFSRHLVNPIWQ